MNIIKNGQIRAFKGRETVNFDTALASSYLVLTMEPSAVSYEGG